MLIINLELAVQTKISTNGRNVKTKPSKPKAKTKVKETFCKRAKLVQLEVQNKNTRKWQQSSIFFQLKNRVMIQIVGIDISTR